MRTDDFRFAWPDYLDLEVEVDWTKPNLHDLLFDGSVDEDSAAFFYSIVARIERRWIPFYFGMIYQQTAAKRNQQIDHRKRLALLRASRPSAAFGITLGTPRFRKGTRITEYLIGELEGLLIYSNWHDQMINKRKVSYFKADRQI